MINHEQIRRYCLAKPGAQEDFSFDPVTPVMKVGGRCSPWFHWTNHPPESILFEESL